MRLKHKVAVAVAAAMLLVGTSVATAVAAGPQQTVALQVGSEMGTGYVGAYGNEILLAPALMTSIELPGDKITFQAYVQDSVDASGNPGAWKWMSFRDFEDIQLEDTNTVQPFSYSIGVDDGVILTDGTVVTPAFPYSIRAEYKVGGSSTSPASFSETETVGLIKNASTRVAISTSGAIRRAGTRLKFQVSPNCGVGTVRVTISKSGSKTLTYNVTTDASGAASQTLKLGSKNGTYKVSARFLGNAYGVASKTAVKNVRASR
jgi:hypothetical protein